MFDMLFGTAGHTVTIKRPTTTYDANMDKQTTYATETLSGCLIAQGDPEGLWERDHAGGVLVDFTLGIPNGYHESWKGCIVTLPAPWSCECDVVADAKYGDPALMPQLLGKWGGVVGLVTHRG